MTSCSFAYADSSAGSMNAALRTVGLKGANKEWLKRERLGCGRLNLLACRK